MMYVIVNGRLIDELSLMKDGILKSELSKSERVAIVHSHCIYWVLVGAGGKLCTRNR